MVKFSNWLENETLHLYVVNVINVVDQMSIIRYLFLIIIYFLYEYNTYKLFSKSRTY